MLPILFIFKVRHQLLNVCHCFVFVFLRKKDKKQQLFPVLHSNGKSYLLILNNSHHLENLYEFFFQILNFNVLVSDHFNHEKLISLNVS